MKCALISASSLVKAAINVQQVSKTLSIIKKTHLYMLGDNLSVTSGVSDVDRSPHLFHFIIPLGHGHPAYALTPVVRTSVYAKSSYSQCSA